MKSSIQRRFVIVIGVLGFATLIVVVSFGWVYFSRSRVVSMEIDGSVRDPESSNDQGAKVGEDTNVFASRAAQREAAGAADGSLSSKVKVAESLLKLGQKKAALDVLRVPAGIESPSQELFERVYGLVALALSPELPADAKNKFLDATNYMLAAEEMKKSEGGHDAEIRIYHKPHARAYEMAACLLDEITRDFNFLPAYISLGIARENLLNFAAAADGYRKYLNILKTNEIREHPQIRQRLIVCEQRHFIDQQMALRVPGLWQVAFDKGDERPTTTTITNDKTHVTTVGPAFTVSAEIELVPGGRVNRGDGTGWKQDKGAYWKVIGRQLIVGGDVGTPKEWCHVGPLASSGNRFEGLNMDLERTRYIKRSEWTRESPDKILRAVATGKVISVTEIKSGKELYKLSFEDELADFGFESHKEPLTILKVRELNDRASAYDAATGKLVIVVVLDVGSAAASLGKIKVALFPDKAPITVANFLRYVDDKHYDGTIFWYATPSWVQGGGLTPELRTKPTYSPIKHEAGNGMFNVRGTVAMVIDHNVPDSVTSSFFINAQDNKILDGTDPNNKLPASTVFGRVIDGMEMIDIIKTIPTHKVGSFENVPVHDVVIRSIRREGISPAVAVIPYKRGVFTAFGNAGGDSNRFGIHFSPDGKSLGAGEALSASTRPVRRT